VIEGEGQFNKVGPGALVLSGASTYTGKTTIQGGVVELGPAAQSPVLSLGGVDIQAALSGGVYSSTKLELDYVAGSDPIAAVTALLKTSCNSGAWNVGQFQSSTVAGTPALTMGCFDNTTTHVITIAMTYAGDFNLDGSVDGLDLNLWKGGIGGSGTWQSGDANYDGAVDGLDLNQWKANIGKTPIVFASDTGSGAASGAGALGASSIPEPGTLALLLPLLALFGYVVAQRRRK